MLITLHLCMTFDVGLSSFDCRLCLLLAVGRREPVCVCVCELSLFGFGLFGALTGLQQQKQQQKAAKIN